MHLGSAHGTYVNKEKIEAAPAKRRLRVGQEVWFGSAEGIFLFFTASYYAHVPHTYGCCVCVYVCVLRRRWGLPALSKVHCLLPRIRTHTYDIRNAYGRGLVVCQRGRYTASYTHTHTHTHTHTQANLATACKQCPRKKTTKRVFLMCVQQTKKMQALNKTSRAKSRH